MTTGTEKAPKASPIVITAPKGGDRTVAPRKGAVAKAIKATGKTLSAIAREHGQNPSQLRRLAADQVAKVDLVRAESIAKALGADMADLFGEAVEKGTGKAKAEPKAAPKARSRAARGATQAAADQAKAGAVQAK